MSDPMAPQQPERSEPATELALQFRSAGQAIRSPDTANPVWREQWASLTIGVRSREGTRAISDESSGVSRGKRGETQKFGKIQSDAANETGTILKDYILNENRKYAEEENVSLASCAIDTFDRNEIAEMHLRNVKNIIALF